LFAGATLAVQRGAPQGLSEFVHDPEVTMCVQIKVQPEDKVRLEESWAIMCDLGEHSFTGQGRQRTPHSILRETTGAMSQQMGHVEIADLVQQMEQTADDPRQCYAIVQQRIAEVRQMGAQVPEDLARLERTLMVECLAESQGR
jgi:hypothetical protein